MLEDMFMIQLFVWWLRKNKGKTRDSEKLLVHGSIVTVWWLVVNC